MDPKKELSDNSKELLAFIHNLISEESTVKPEKIEEYKNKACEISRGLPENITTPETEEYFLQAVICWALIGAYQKRKGNTPRDSESRIAEQKLIEEKISSEPLYKNKAFLRHFKNKISFLPGLSESEQNEVYAFVSFCLFAPASAFLSNLSEDFLDYSNQINGAILNKVYFDSLNNQLTWRWRAPDSTGPQEYRWEAITKEDFEKGRIIPVCISLEQACIWAHLNYVLSKPMAENSVSCFPDYQEYLPGIEHAFDLLLKMTFSAEYKAKSKNERAQIALFVFSEIHHIWQDNSPESSKPAGMEYYELYPGYVYCLYKLIPEFDKNTFNYIFPDFQKATGNYNRLRFLAFLDQKGYDLSSPAQFELCSLYGFGAESIDYEKILNWYPEKEDTDAYTKYISEPHQMEKLFLLSCMFYFFLWDFAAEWHEFIPSEDNSYNLGFEEHTKLMESFFAPFLDKRKSWMQSFTSEQYNEIKNTQVRIPMTWTDTGVMQNLLNSVLEKYHCNGLLSDSDFEKLDPGILKIIIFNLSKFRNRDRSCLLSMMDFVGEQRNVVKLYVQARKDKKYESKKTAVSECELLEKKQQVLREEIDKGFELNLVKQHPVPDSGFVYFRKLTCKFFNDTDKVYKRKTKPCGRKHNWIIDNGEDFRISSSNNLYTHYLYCAERNTERHYSNFSALNSVMNDAYPKNLLFAFIDARDFLLLQKEEKKDSPDELLQLDYLLHFLELLLNVFVKRFNLLDEEKLKGKSVWQLLYTNDKKNLKIQLPDEMDYQEVLGNQYLFDLKWLFEFLFCVKSDFLEDFYNEISVYLIYLAVKMNAFDMTALENN